MTWNNYHSIYFAGIGGIGMSALARYFHTMGLPVSGYDKTATPLTQLLEKEGMSITYLDSLDTIPENIRASKDGVLVVFTPALPATHLQMKYFRDQGYSILKRSEVLGLITKGNFTIAVAGTHGKTTTSSIVAHLLKEKNRSFTAFLGGIASNFDSNYIHHKGEGEPVIVVEADEYDRSFLRLHPNISIVTSADADHLDIYGTDAEIKQGFKEFINQTAQDGTLVINDKIKDLSVETLRTTYTYGIDRGQFFASNITINDGFFAFDLYANDSIYRSLTLGVPGFYNIENAIAAIAAMEAIGEDISSLSDALITFKGVKRRFEFILRTNDLVYIDDYAHHPEEIRAFLESVKVLFPERKLYVIFQPHLFTRTRDFAEGFGKSLSLADQVLLLDIYPARELPLPGITSEFLLEKITTNKQLVTKSFVADEFTPEKNAVVVTVGAGDIDQLVEPLKKRWAHEKVY